ncbi:PH domain-containing protein [Streptomyces sp. NPDC093228]|uniref:PH domain-containing protein n=1 Tax=Streptomyces sp. NPDC093228 TaxID=3155070 RepID=UPI0034237200
MTDVPEVTCRSPRRGTLRLFVGLGALGVCLTAGSIALGGALLVVGATIGLALIVVGTVSLHYVFAQVSADVHGVHVRTLLRRSSVPWGDIVDLYIFDKPARNAHIQRRVGLSRRSGHKRLLPLPVAWSYNDPDFDTTVDSLRELHRRHSGAEPGRLPVVTPRTAGRGWIGSLVLGAALLAGAGVAAYFVPIAAADEQAWKAAAPCTVQTSVQKNGDCLSTVPAVIARTEPRQPKQSSWLYFTESRPLHRLEVSEEAAEEFEAGDRVELTVWHHQVMEVAGAGHIWREHVTGGGEVAVVAAVLALAAGYPGAQVLLRLRGRRLPDDEVLPSALPFAGALLGTALWLLPLCYLHPTTLLEPPVALTWSAAGSLLSLGLFALAWRATRVRTPGVTEATDGVVHPDGEVFLAARFLEHTDYNPHGFGTHVLLGDGPPAVTPHAGPGRFAAKRIPAQRITVTNVRRARGADGDTVPSNWHIAELEDEGRSVRLAAAPDDLTRILRELEAAKTPVDTANPEG